MANYLKNLLGEKYKEGMTEEEISEALEKASIKSKGEDSNEVKKLKELLSKTNSEAADYKKQLRAKQSEAERKDAETKELLEKAQAELETMKQEKKLSEYTAQFTAQGYDADSAKTVAEAFINGDLETLLKSQKDLFDKKEAVLKSELVKKTPRPASGSTGGEKMTKDKINAMSFEDRMNYIKEHKDEYTEIMKEKD